MLWLEYLTLISTKYLSSKELSIGPWQATEQLSVVWLITTKSYLQRHATFPFAHRMSFHSLAKNHDWRPVTKVFAHKKIYKSDCGERFFFSVAVSPRQPARDSATADSMGWMCADGLHGQAFPIVGRERSASKVESEK